MRKSLLWLLQWQCFGVNQQIMLVNICNMQSAIHPFPHKEGLHILKPPESLVVEQVPQEAVLS